MEITPKFIWNGIKDDLITDFYRPALSNAKLYQRKAGYFSSTSFLQVIDEILDLIKRNGRIQLITSPNLSAEDRMIFLKSVDERTNTITKHFLDDLKNDPDKKKHNFAQIIGFMLQNIVDNRPQLEIKIAITNDGEGIFHDKSGIIHLENEKIISFVGSINETYSAWSRNHECFVAFYSWIDDKEFKLARDIQSDFENIWNKKDKSVITYDLPEAVKNNLLKISPKSQEEFEEILQKVFQSKSIEDNLEKPSPPQTENNNDEKELRSYQKVAINNWIQNDFCGIFAMATGTGKTFTAFGCINELQKSNERIITIISVPLTHLVEQWETQLSLYNKKFESNLRVNSENIIKIYGEKQWKPKLTELIVEFNRRLFSSKNYEMNNMLIFVTHQTARSEEFIEKIRQFKDTKIFLVVDEVHNVGTEKNQKSLLSEYDFRLGLSATPKRHYDEEGTSRLFDYFRGEVFEYSLSQAIKDKWLCEYEYFPSYAEFTNDEMNIYHELTRKIAAKLGNKKYSTMTDEDDRNDPANKRADLISNAENKLLEFRKLCDSRNWIFNKTLIYCTSNPSPRDYSDSTQLDKVNKILTDKHVAVTSVTFKNPTTDRLEILNNLDIGHYDCITAVRCLDEGIDIPSIDTAIILASSGNPKQFIQRRGRVLRKTRKDENKIAKIYDILVKPPKDSNELRERKLLAKELLRHKEFAESSINPNEANAIIREVAEEYLGANILEKLDYEYIKNME